MELPQLNVDVDDMPAVTGNISVLDPYHSHPLQMMMMDKETQRNPEQHRVGISKVK